MNSLQKATSLGMLRKVWERERTRLRDSCFGIDRQDGRKFAKHLDRELRDINDRLERGFKSVGLLALAKPKGTTGQFRIICVPTIGERLLQFSLLDQLRPGLGRMGIDNPISYGIARGQDRSVLGARKFACVARDARPWVYKTDIQKFFDNIGRPTLERSIEKVVRQGSLVPLLKRLLHAEIEDGLDPKWRKIAADNGIVRGRGVRQGMPLSPFFAGAYLRDVDRFIIGRGVAAARYVDDIVAFFESEAEAYRFHDMLKIELQALGLIIGEPGEANSKTAIYAPGQPADFLGMQISYSPVGQYRLQVAPTTINKIVSKINDAGSVAALLDRRASLTTMGTFFRSLECGYFNAYSGAHNHDVLQDAIKRAARKAQERVLRELFGEEALASLTASQLRFLGVEVQT